jgi:hypothetical protein
MKRLFQVVCVTGLLAAAGLAGPADNWKEPPDRFGEAHR